MIVRREFEELDVVESLIEHLDVSGEGLEFFVRWKKNIVTSGSASEDVFNLGLMREGVSSCEGSVGRGSTTESGST